MSNDYDTNTASASPQERQPPLNRRFEFASRSRNCRVSA